MHLNVCTNALIKKSIDIFYYKHLKKAFSIGDSGVITNRPKLAYELLTQMGKRYVDADDTIELLCTKPGEGSLGLGDALLTIKESKPLPASD